MLFVPSSLDLCSSMGFHEDRAFEWDSRADRYERFAEAEAVRRRWVRLTALAAWWADADVAGVNQAYVRLGADIRAGVFDGELLYLHPGLAPAKMISAWFAALSDFVWSANGELQDLLRGLNGGNGCRIFRFGPCAVQA